MSDYTPPQRKKNAFNNNKLTLSAPLPNNKGVYSVLSFDIFKNNPRVVVATKDPSLMNKDNSFGKITAALDPAVFFMLLQYLDIAIQATGPVKNKIENNNHDFENGQRSQEIKHLTDIWVGRDQEGHVFMSVVSTKPNWPVLKFIFGPSDNRYHKFLKGDGTPWTRAELSVLGAKAYYNLLTQLAGSVLDTHYEEPPAPQGWKNKQGGGGGGYGGGNRNGGGGYNQRPQSQQSFRDEAPKPSSDDLDDSIPFN